MVGDLLRDTVASVGPLDDNAMALAQARQDVLTKPRGSLGRLEALSVQLAGIQGRARPKIRDKAIITMAGDHGVTVEGISPYPSEVTPQMVLNFLAGGAGINVLARHAGARVVVVDVGVASDVPEHPQLIVKKVARGTANMAIGPAMSGEQAIQAVETGIQLVAEQAALGLDIVGTGDMGIGNTTPSSAIVACITGEDVRRVTGRGAGLDDLGFEHKVQVIQRALDVNRPDPRDALDVLGKVGGLEIGGLAGVIIGASARRIPVVVDGFISGAAALIATTLCPAAQPYLIAAHNSVESGHAAALAHMNLSPLLNLNLRLGEGTGAALAISLVEAAAKILDEMATFEEAGVSGEKKAAEQLV